MLLLIFLLLHPVHIQASQTLDLLTVRDQEFLVRKEPEFLAELVAYTEVLEEHVSLIRRYLSDYSATESLYVEGNQSTLLNEDLPKTALLNFKLLQRTSQLRHLEVRSLYHSAAAAAVAKYVDNCRSEFTLPTRADLAHARHVLGLLCTTYKLDLDDLEQGIIMGKVTGSGLEPIHFYELGKDFLKKGFFLNAVNFLDKARTSSAAKDAENSTVYENMYRIAANTHDEAFDNETTPKMYLFEQKISETPHLRYNQCRKLERSENTVSTGSDIEEDYTSTHNAVYLELCREKFFPRLEGGTNYLNISFSPENFIQKCFLSSKLHPFWILNPMRVEVISKDPFIVMCHGVLTYEQMQRMKSFVAPGLTRSEVTKDESLSQGTDQRRLSSSNVPDVEDVKLWDRKVELYTGLKAMNTHEAESLQVTSYPNGGFFTIHSDAFQSSSADENKMVGFVKMQESIMEKLEDGDRIATFMFYLSTVELGGRTGFPFLNLSVRPEEGSALIWYNLHPDGSFDNRVVHAGCPVVLGTKWIATKWIYSDAQMFLRKCSKENYAGFNPWFYSHYDF